MKNNNGNYFLTSESVTEGHPNKMANQISDTILEVIKKIFDLRPGAIIKNLHLRRPIYQKVACYGHFGRTEFALPWGKTNKVKMLKKYFKT